MPVWFHNILHHLFVVVTAERDFLSTCCLSDVCYRKPDMPPTNWSHYFLISHFFSVCLPFSVYIFISAIYHKTNQLNRKWMNWNWKLIQIGQVQVKLVLMSMILVDCRHLISVTTTSCMPPVKSHVFSRKFIILFNTNLAKYQVQFWFWQLQRAQLIADTLITIFCESYQNIPIYFVRYK